VADERQWRDITYCISLLPFKSDRSFKKLVEGLPYYQDKLHEPVVFQRFQDILQKVPSLSLSLYIYNVLC
jgi:condensin complex subunit 1